MSNNQNTPNTSNDTKNIAEKSASAGIHSVKAAKKGKNILLAIITHPVPFFIFLLILVVIVLVSGTSSVELGKTFYLSTSGNSNSIYMPSSEKEKEESLWDKNVITKTQSNLLSIIETHKKENKEVAINGIRTLCQVKGWDVEETLSHLKENSEVSSLTAEVITSSGNKGKVLKTYDVSKLSKTRLSTFEWKDIKRSWPSGSYQEKIANSENSFFDRYGLAKYKEGTLEDYLVSLPDIYGKEGDRFRITFKNGTSASFRLLKTSNTDKGILSFYVDKGILDKKAKDENNIAALYSNMFDSISKIEKVEGDVETKEIISVSSINTRIFSAYSVSIANSQLKRITEISPSGQPSYKYVDQKGNTVDVKTNSLGEIDYEKDLEAKLKEYDGGYYDIVYEQGKNGYKVYSKEIKYTEIVYDEETEKEKEVEKTKTIYYVVPMLLEKDINNIAENLFGINPNEKYINGTEETTNGEAITTLAANTQSLIYGTSATYIHKGSIMQSELSGKYAWPVPGCNIITSDFGPRKPPTAGASSNHKGIDIGCKMNSPVVAVEDGEIVLAQYYGGYGNAIILKTKDSCRAIYGHLNKIAVSPGQKVKKGEVIAYSGNTGISTGPHLHIEIHDVNNNEMDPTVILLKSRSDAVYL